jgi:hypothetical protein
MIKQQMKFKSSMDSPTKHFTAEKKLQLSLQLYYLAFELKSAALKKFHPELSDTEIRQKVTKIFSHAMRQSVSAV